MTPTETPKQARRRRIATIRRRVAATTLTTFALAFGVISFTGSMGAETATTSALHATATTGSSTSATTSDDSSQPLAAVTTRQS